MHYIYTFLSIHFSAEIEQKYQEIMKQTGILTLNGQVRLTLFRAMEFSIYPHIIK